MHWGRQVGFSRSLRSAVTLLAFPCLLPSRHPVGPKCSSEQRKHTLISPNRVSFILISLSKQDYSQTALYVSLLINCLDRVAGNSCGGIDGRSSAVLNHSQSSSQRIIITFYNELNMSDMLCTFQCAPYLILWINLASELMQRVFCFDSVCSGTYLFPDDLTLFSITTLSDCVFGFGAWTLSLKRPASASTREWRRYRLGNLANSVSHSEWNYLHI